MGSSCTLAAFVDSTDSVLSKLPRDGGGGGSTLFRGGRIGTARSGAFFLVCSEGTESSPCLKGFGGGMMLTSTS